MASVLAASIVASAGTATAGRVEVFLNLPSEMAAGETIDVPISVKDGREDVVSYAFRLTYDPTVLKVVGIKGGTFEGFSDPPVSNPATYGSGQVDFTANNVGNVPTSESFILASIKFQVVGAAGQKSKVQLRSMPRNELTIRRTFRRASVRFAQARRIVTVK